MDLLLLIGIAVSLLLILLTILYFNKKETTNVPAPASREVPVRLQQGVPIRAQIARNQRNRARTVVAEQAPSQVQAAQDDSEESDEDNDRLRPNFGGEKIGAKKRAKLEAKAEKKAHREAELQQREDRKMREALAAEEQKKLDDKEKLEEKKREEAERLARELKEKQEYEEYLQMKAAFSVEEEGFDETESTESDNLLQEFVNHIKDNKVVMLEDVARTFKLKTQAAIDRIQELKANGTINGVLDDRGKFIYICEEELEAVAKFIRQRGRISITELAESSNNLINLTPVSTA